jgi:hypothetical protein
MLGQHAVLKNKEACASGTTFCATHLLDFRVEWTTRVAKFWACDGFVAVAAAVSAADRPASA